MSITPTPSVTPSAPVTDYASPPPKGRGWTPGRVVSLVAGCMLGLVSLGLLTGGGWATWTTNTQRDSTGYLTADPHVVSTSGYVVTSKEVADLVNGPYSGWLGTARVRVTPTDPADKVFVGVASTRDVNTYLSGVDRTVVTDWFPYETDQVTASGKAPRAAPTDVKIWTASTSGPGTQTLKWKPSSDTTVVVMNADARAGVRANADIGATVPDLVWLAVVLLVFGGLGLAVALVLVVVPVTRASK